MALAEYVRCNAIGRFMSGPWLGEEAQIGFSLCRPVGGDFPTGIDDALTTFDVAPGGGSETVAGVGRFDYGSFALEGAPFSKTEQKTITTHFKTYLSGRLNWLMNTFKWHELRYSAITANGSVINGATVVTLSPTLDGTDTVADFPPQTAIVQSLTTGGRGPRNRGRWYVPVHGAVPIAQGLVTSAAATGLNDAAKALKDNLEGSIQFKMAVVSPTHHTASEITTFRVGNHVDTQRRRATGVQETFTELQA